MRAPARTKSRCAAALIRAREESHAFEGIIQHSFALPIPEGAWPFDGWTNSERISERFNSGEFRARPIGKIICQPGREANHSPLAESKSRLTTHESLKPTFMGPNPRDKLPAVFGWSAAKPKTDRGEFEEPRLIFADCYDDELHASINDFIVTDRAEPADREKISQFLLELMAHKRSRLFGFPLANRFVNALLPYAILRPHGGVGSSGRDVWFLQPLVSFIRGGRDRGRLRNTYVLTLFFIPILDQYEKKGRPISISEIARVVNPGWGFAAAPRHDRSEELDMSGPLLRYLSHLARFDLHEMRWPTRTSPEMPDPYGPITLRQAVERIAFGVDLSVAQGKVGKAGVETTRRIGNDVITALGSTRVSSVVVVDPDLTEAQVQKPTRDGPYPGRLLELMETLAGTARIPQKDDKEAQRYRLDRPAIDGKTYAIGVLPIRRCIVVLGIEKAQYGIDESALMQAGSAAYMTIGAAMAIGAMRQIDRRLEYQEDAENPKKIAKIDAEIASDLGEIYDLDITRESFREVYRLLRDRLGITRDYKTLQDKMQSLYRATSTVHEDKAQSLLAWLTAGIVALSLLILIGTAVLAGKGG